MKIKHTIDPALNDPRKCFTCTYATPDGKRDEDRGICFRCENYSNHIDELKSDDLLPVLQPVIITTSLEGDWVRVTKGDERLIDNHVISPNDLKACLEQLGFEVRKEERPADEF